MDTYLPIERLIAAARFLTLTQEVMDDLYELTHQQLLAQERYDLIKRTCDAGQPIHSLLKKEAATLNQLKAQRQQCFETIRNAFIDFLLS